MEKLKKIKKNDLKLNDSVLSKDGMKAIKGGMGGKKTYDLIMRAGQPQKKNKERVG